MTAMTGTGNQAIFVVQLCRKQLIIGLRPQFLLYYILFCLLFDADGQPISDY